MLAKYGVRIGCIFLVAVIDVGLSAFFSRDFYAPSAVMMLAVVWTITGNFVLMYAWIATTGLFADIFLFRPIGYTAAVAVFLSYSIGFLSRRFLVQHVFWGNMAIALLLFVSTFSYNIFHVAVFSFYGTNLDITGVLRFMYEQFSFTGLIRAFLVNVVLFFVLKRSVDFMDRSIALSQTQVEPKRHR